MSTVFDARMSDPTYAATLGGYTPASLGLVGQGDNGGFGVPMVPKVSGAGFGGLDFSQKAGLGLQGLSTLGGLVMGLKQLSLANKQFKSSEAFAKTNLANQVKSYNTALADRVRSRAWTETGSLSGVDAEVDKNKLSTAY